jgi:hypothetical protein
MELEQPHFIRQFGEPLMNIFPNEYQLANMVLFHLKLPTSEEQMIVKRRAKYQAQMGLIIKHMARSEVEGSNDDLPEELKSLADAEKIEGALFQYSLSGQINALDDLSLLEQTERARTINALKEVTRKHDEALKRFGGKFPMFQAKMWEIFRKTREIKSHSAHYAMNKNSIIEAAIKEAKSEGGGEYILTLETDEQWTNYYQQQNFSWETQQLFNIEPSYRLVEFDKNYMLGIGRYAFAKPNGDIFQTIWDLRQKEVQYFKYNPR